MFKLVHAGFDTLDIAIQGALPAESLAQLETARDEAADRQEAVLITLGPEKVAMHVSGNGMRGGYAFVTDTGPVGCKWFFKKNHDAAQWNIFVSPRATALLAHGYHGTRDRIWEELANMGAEVMDHSINRVDFAMDFQTSGFELSLGQFVAHAHTKVRPHWGEVKAASDSNQPSAVMRGRRLESVTIGKMPGRQIIVYDKRREAIERNKLFWFRAWGLERTERDVQVWRVEIRAGKKELKTRWNMRRCDDLEANIGDVFSNALNDVRYIADYQSDSNVTRQHLHPLWTAAQTAAEQQLVNYRSGLLPGQIIYIERAHAADQYTSLIIGNAIGYGVARGLSDKEVFSLLPTLIAARAEDRIKNDRDNLWRAINRARERLHFIQE